MSKGYIYRDNQLVETIEHSCDGQSKQWCSHCQETTEQQLVGVSDIRGNIWSCMKCYRESSNGQ